MTQESATHAPPEPQAPPPAAPPRPTSKLASMVPGLVAGAVVLALLGVGWKMGFLQRLLKPGGAGEEESAPASTERPSEVELSAEKAKFADLRIGKATRQPVRETRAVPGRVNYDASKHLDITLPIECVVREVLVEPGQEVEEGQKLVVLSSAAIGLARDEVMKREADLELARREHDWAEEIAENVEALLKRLKQHPKWADLEQQIETASLGDYQEKLVAAYSKLLLAESIANSTNEADGQSALSRRVVEERRSNREIAAATFKGACESARFEAMKDHERAHAAEEQAARMLAISRDRLLALLGSQGELAGLPMSAPTKAPAASVNPPSASENPPPSENPPTPGAGGKKTKGDLRRERMAFDDVKLSEFFVRAPIAGRIEERHVANAARVAEGKPLFTIANTDTLWVEAEIHERDWRALEHAAHGTVTIRVPALKEAEFPTKLRYIGAKVSADTRSVPLVVDLNNEEDRFKPGMFVWVDVPLEAERTAIVVPPGAVMRHEEQAFVFVPDGPNKFRRVDVVTGLETSRGIEIVSGLEDGQEVVDHGAFFLKSELLLDKEAD